MGVFYYIHSVALVEDLPLELHYKSPEEFYAAADRAYSQVFTVIWSQWFIKLFTKCFRMHTTAGSLPAFMLVLSSSQHSSSTQIAVHQLTKPFDQKSYVYIYMRNSEILCL